MLQGERTDTDLVLAVSGGESSAYGELFDRWFNSSWNVARNILRDDDLAADVAQDALLNAWQRLDQLDNPDAFGGWLLRITRNRALTRLERERRSRATGDDVVSGLRDAGAPDPTGAEQPLGPDAISEVRDRQELLWAAAGALGEKEASLLDLHLRHGLGPAEIAEELGVEANNAHQQLYRLRTKLGDAIGSYLLWRNGRPLCDGLAAAVSGDVAFDKSVARAVTRHQKNCDACAERRTGLVDPSKLFAAVPLVLVPSHLKANAAAALQSAGVPTSSAGSAGSASSGSVGGSAGPSTNPGASGAGGGGDGGASAFGNGIGGADASGGVFSSSGSGAGAGSAAPGSTMFSSAASSSLAGGATAGVLAETAGPGGPPLVTTLAENVSRPKLLLLAGGGVVTALVVGILGYLLLKDTDESATAAVVQAGIENLADDESGDGPAGPSGSAGDNGDGTTGDFTSSSGESEGEIAGRGSAAGNDGDAVAPGGSNDDQSDDGSDSESPGGDNGDTEDPPEPTEPDPITTTTEPETVTTPPTDPDPVTTPPTDPDPVTTPPTDPDPVTTPPTDPDPVTTPPTDPDPVTTPPTDPDPVTTPPTDPDPVTTPTPPPVDPPEIIRFTSRRSLNSNLICQARTQAPYDAIWATEGAEKAELTTAGGTISVAASGSHAFCGSRGETLRLVVVNASGEDKATTTLQ